MIMDTHTLLNITLGAIVINNVVLSRILGLCPFLGVSRKFKTAIGMSGAVVFVMTLSSFVTAVLNELLLRKPVHIGTYEIDLNFTRTLLFIAVIASLVQAVEILLKRFSTLLYMSLGIYLPLITTNCAVLGAVEINADASYGILGSTIFGCSTGIGFGLAVILFASLRERLKYSRVPLAFQGTSIALITAGILAMAFQGFSGMIH